MPVAKVEITARGSFAGGKTFGDAGRYELVEGVAHYAIDPLHSANERIVDVELAPRDSSGRVWFSSKFAMLQPVEEGAGKGHLFFDVVNRGRKTTMYSFNSGPRLDPTAPLEEGNGYLMREGYTVVFGGWQADVPDSPGLIGMRAPDALGPDGQPLVGRIMHQFQVDAPTQLFYLADRQHLPHPPVDANDPNAKLYVKDHPNESATPIDRSQFSFVRVEDDSEEPEPHHLYFPAEFEPGRIYQIVYETRGSTVVGLGFAAMRDMVSFFKHATRAQGNPCTDDIRHAYAFGASQSGRFLRQYLHTGMNQDEEGRMALDGIIAHVAGGMRGEFNLRFGQPSKDVCYITPELFPFTDTDQTDPVTGATGSILANMREQGQVPKIMFTNTAAEYWRGDAALIHTDLETMTDAPEDSEHVRRYQFSGTQHGSGAFPPEMVREPDGLRGQLPFNSVDYAPLLRAVLHNLDRWVSEGIAPPASRHPSLDKGTAVVSETLLPRFKEIPGVRVPLRTTRAMRLDYGSELHHGRTLKLPPEQGEEYPALVSDVDEQRNEVGGICLPDVTEPVATYTGWNLRHESKGNPDLVIGITGGLAGWTLGLPPTKEKRKATGDPRKSIEELYASKDEYLTRVKTAAEKLAGEGYLLDEDVERVTERAGTKYDYFTAAE